MNVNDELRDTLDAQMTLLERHNYRAYLVSTMDTDNMASIDTTGEFSDLFKMLFDVSCQDVRVRGLVLSVAEALRAWERLSSEQNKY